MPFGASRVGLMSGRRDAIPDSEVARYIATEEDSEETSTMTDQVGNLDLSGQFQMESNGVNGEQSYQFGNQSGDVARTTDINFAEEPWGVVATLNFDNWGDNDILLAGRDNTAEVRINDDNSTEVALHRGGERQAQTSFDTDLIENDCVMVLECFDTDRVRWELNGNEILDDSNAPSDLTEFYFGNRSDEDISPEFDCIELSLVEGADSGDFNEIRDRHADEHGITIS